MAVGKRNWGRIVLILGAVVIIAGVVYAVSARRSRDAGREFRRTFETGKELAGQGLEKGKEAAKESLEKTREAAQDFKKGWEEGKK